MTKGRGELKSQKIDAVLYEWPLILTRVMYEEENRQQTLKSGRHDYYEKLLKHAFKHLDRQRGAA